VESFRRYLIMRRRRTVHRFFNRLKSTIDCWLWEGRLDKDGYGIFGKIRAHRWSYEVFREEIPRGLQIDHLCRVRNCVNPWHLEPVTSQENTRRGIQFRKFKTHCPKGHEYTGNNVYYHPTKNFKTCRKCKSLQMKQARSKVYPL